MILDPKGLAIQLSAEHPSGHATTASGWYFMDLRPDPDKILNRKVVESGKWKVVFSNIFFYSIFGITIYIYTH